MRHRKHTFKIGRPGSHRRAMMANMICSLIEHGEIKTTLAKAKEARRFADKMITLGKKGTLHHRRLAVARLHSKDAVKALFDEISPRYGERSGGYTRIIRINGPRRGDGAEVCILQLVEEGMSSSKPKKKKEEKAAAAEADVKAEAPAEEAKAETETAVQEEAPAEEAASVETDAKDEAPAEETTEEENKDS